MRRNPKHGTLCGTRNLDPRRGAPIGLSEKLDQLQAKSNEVVATARAAAESRDQLKQRVDQAQVEAKLAMQDAKQQADELPIGREQVGADEGRCCCQERGHQGKDREAGRSAGRQSCGQRRGLGRAGCSRCHRLRRSRSSTTRSWPCSTRWTHALTPTNRPRSPPCRSRREQVNCGGRTDHRPTTWKHLPLTPPALVEACRYRTPWTSAWPGTHALQRLRRNGCSRRRRSCHGAAKPVRTRQH